VTPREADLRIINLISSSPISSQLGFWELKSKVWRSRKVSKVVERTILNWEKIFKILESKKEWWDLKTEFVTGLHTGRAPSIKESMLELTSAVALAEGILIRRLQ
jgi:hypothetical protein